MPRLIDPPPVTAPLSPEDATAALTDLRFDPEDAGAWDAAVPILAALSADRGFLGRLAVAELAGSGRRGGTHHYGPQVIMLGQGKGNWFLRANMWPAERDALLRASGRGAFFYDLPHDHNFSFLTIGHLGPGYESDYWSYDGESAQGLDGEAVALRYEGRHRLELGRMMLYRAHRDIHDQKPPAAFSVTLNLMESSGREPWRDQYRFDPAEGRVTGLLNQTAIEGLMPLAAHLGGGNGEDLLRGFARSHPVDRIRIGAIRALAGAAPGPDSRRTLFEDAARGGDPAVSAAAFRALEREEKVRRWVRQSSEMEQ